MSGERRTLYICEECGEPGWEFHRRGDCEYGTGRHHGKHGGPVEVIPASDLLSLEEENKKLQRVFTAAANVVFWASDEDQLREKLVNLREAIIGFNAPALATLPGLEEK